MIIACLHTLPSSIELFDTALEALGESAASLRHEVRADLLAEAEAAGGLTAPIAANTRLALEALRQGADAVLLTCSTLGPAVDGFAEGAAVLRVDKALAQEAVRDGGRVVVLYTSDTTRGPTRDLFEAEAAMTGSQIEMRQIEGAWHAFRRGDLAGYHAMIAKVADQFAFDGASTIALAQASMAGAARLSAARLLTSPAAGLRAAIKAIGALAEISPRAVHS